MPANLYLVLVNVRYSKNGSHEHRQWPVRIVAFDAESAQTGAMAWAELQQADGISADAKRFANTATTMDVIGRVDCIGESVIDGSRRFDIRGFRDSVKISDAFEGKKEREKETSVSFSPSD